MNNIVYNIDKVIDEINACLENKLYLAALHLALTLPDLGAMAQYNLTKSNGKIYIDWVNEWMTPFLGGKLNPIFIDDDGWGLILYKLRCKVFHNNSLDFAEDLNSEYFEMEDFSLFLEETKSTFDYAMVIKENKISCLNEYYNGLTISVNVILLINALIGSTHVFLNKYKDHIKDYDTIQIYLKNKDKPVRLILPITTKEQNDIYYRGINEIFRKKAPFLNPDCIYLYNSETKKIVAKSNKLDITQLPIKYFKKYNDKFKLFTDEEMVQIIGSNKKVFRYVFYELNTCSSDIAINDNELHKDYFYIEN